MASYLKPLRAPRRRRARAMPQRGPGGQFVKAPKVKAPRKAARSATARVGAALGLMDMPLAREARRSMHVQTLLFRRADGWTEARAKAWASRHGYKTSKVDVTSNHIRLRQEAPGKTKIKRTVSFGKGISAVVGRETSTVKEGSIVMARRRKRSSRVPAHKPFPIPRRRRKAAKRRKACKRTWTGQHRRWGRVHGHTRRTHEPQAAAAPRRRRRARAYALTPRTRTIYRTRTVQAPRRRRRRHYSREAAVVQARRHHRRRHRYARANPMFGGEFALAVISGGLGFVLADAVDRYLATYDPTGTTPSNKFTSPNGTLANTLNIASPPSLIRIGAGVGMVILPALGSTVVRGSMARSALQGMTIGAGVKLFASLFNSYVMANLLKSSAQSNAASIGNRLYPAEITATLNIASATGSPQVSGLLSKQAGRLADNAPSIAPVVPVSPVGNPIPYGSSPVPTPTPMPPGGSSNGPTPGGGGGGECSNCGCQTGDCGCLAAKPRVDTHAFSGLFNGQ